MEKEESKEDHIFQSDGSDTFHTQQANAQSNTQDTLLEILLNLVQSMNTWMALRVHLEHAVDGLENSCTTFCHTLDKIKKDDLETHNVIREAVMITSQLSESMKNSEQMNMSIQKQINTSIDKQDEQNHFFQELVKDTNCRISSLQTELSELSMAFSKLTKKFEQTENELTEKNELLEDYAHRLSETKIELDKVTYALNVTTIERLKSEQELSEEKKLRLTAQKSLVETQSRYEEAVEQLTALNCDNGIVIYISFQEYIKKHNHLQSPIISSMGFDAFAFSCCSKSSIKFIYDHMREAARESKMPVDHILDSLLQYCMDMYNRVYSANLHRQAVQIGDEYSMGLHRKRISDPEVGFVSHVRLPGIMQNDYEVFERCYALVDVKA